MSKVTAIANNSNLSLSDSEASEPLFQSRTCLSQEGWSGVVYQGLMGRKGYQSGGKGKFDVRYIEVMRLEGAFRGECLLFPWKNVFPLEVSSLFRVHAGNTSGDLQSLIRKLQQYFKIVITQTSLKSKKLMRRSCKMRSKPPD